MEKDFFLSLEIERRECVTLTLRWFSRTTATKSTYGRGRLCLALEKISLRISSSICREAMQARKKDQRQQVKNSKKRDALPERSAYQ